MVRNKQGVYAPKQKKVVVLWDLENKPPRGPPYEAALAMKTVAQKFGELVDMSAYANRYAFIHLPQWVLQERSERRSLDILERKGIVTPAEPYICGVCGRKCKTNLDLKKHFKQLHERERRKKLNRLKSFKGKKRQRFKERGLGRHADLWVSWVEVENGELTKKDLVPKRRMRSDDGLFSASEFDGGNASIGELDGVVNELLVERKLRPVYIRLILSLYYFLLMEIEMAYTKEQQGNCNACVD
ncbi:transcription factor LHW-like [Hibiscus syriacus]|uniref:Transcription factor LHW-like n=1 Tax=Hibiscus syriacus TaxID=106335 RepID=A0A6A3CDD4_HIBSY|nr:transcription factor LHW-like [Hibiscus syriacus]